MGSSAPGSRARTPHTAWAPSSGAFSSSSDRARCPRSPSSGGRTCWRPRCGGRSRWRSRRRLPPSRRSPPRQSTSSAGCSATPTNEERRSVRDGRTGRGRWLALGALVLSGLVIEIDVFVLVTALPTLSTRLGATTTQLQWLSDAYTLAVAGLLLPAGVVGDRVGRRRVLLAGLALFGLSSVAASRMTSVEGLIAMRAVMGVGAAV